MDQADTSGLPPEQGSKEGIWITADPIPGCVVCNIGESKPDIHILLSWLDLFTSVGDMDKWVIHFNPASCNSQRI